MTIKSYKSQAKFFLFDTFDWISCPAITLILQHVGFGFSNAYAILSQLMAVHPDEEAGNALFPHLQPNVTIFLKKRRSKQGIRVQDERLLAEIALPRVFKCLCCFEEFPAEELRKAGACNANSLHTVCQQCINSYVRVQVNENNRVDFTCIVDPECKGVYRPALLDRVLTPDTKKRTNDAVFRYNVRESGMEVWYVRRGQYSVLTWLTNNLQKNRDCPKCDNMGFLEQGATTNYCNPCSQCYCAACKDVVHQGNTCEEVADEKRRLADPRHRAHEVMSAAVTRRCPNPNCSVTAAFMIGDGCNKMTCRVCQTSSCYLCEKQVVSYSTHFCNCNLQVGVPCRRCGNSCRLYTSPEAMIQHDREKRQAAGKKVYEQAGKSQEEIRLLLASPEQENHRNNHATPPRANAARAADRMNRALGQVRPGRVPIAQARAPLAAHQAAAVRVAARVLRAAVNVAAGREVQAPPQVVLVPPPRAPIAPAAPVAARVPQAAPRAEENFAAGRAVQAPP
jgi:hypothetical protein